MSPSEVLERAGLPRAARPVPLSGGDMGEVWRVGDLVVKTGLPSSGDDAPRGGSRGRAFPVAPPGMFPAEARGLRTLAAAGVRVPEVHWVSDAGLVLSWLPSGPPDPLGLADQLARLHAARQVDYGVEETVFLGRFPLPPGRSQAWLDVLRDLRLVPLREAAHARLGGLGPRLDRLLARLTVPEEGPVVVHGDLWSGNVLWTSQGAALIDPCAQRAERALDLAMMRLFGGFSSAFWTAYTERLPIPDDVEAAIQVHQLVYLIVHVIFFGGSYLSAVDRALTAAERA